MNDEARFACAHKILTKHTNNVYIFAVKAAEAHMLTEMHTRDDFLRQLLEEETRVFEQRLATAYPMPSDEEAIILLRENRTLEDHFLEIALLARGFGNHYRRPDPYHVGAVMVGLADVPSGQNPWRVRFSANTKPAPDEVKWCAEWWLMEGALKENGSRRIRRIIGFFIVGEPRADDISGFEGPTLTPCKICRDRMFVLSLASLRGNEAERWGALILPETLVITADYRNLGLRKHLKAARLHPLHKEPAMFKAEGIDD